MSQTDYRFQLESPRLTGHRQQKTTCPQCQRSKCFVRYVDTHNQCRYLDNSVGRCDHEQSCGYHYRPAEYYRDNPWMAEPNTDRRPFRTATPPTLPPPLVPLPMSLVLKNRSKESTFWQWLCNDVARALNIDQMTTERVYDDYLIGATPHKEVIFWQIDEQQRVRSGHIMTYGSDGRRKATSSWMHYRLQRQNQLPAGFQLHQCFFGQHLLPRRPDDHVCLVESQKTAVIMSACYPSLLWLATCGSSGLSVEKLSCLKGRRLTLFPDSGCLEKWSDVMRRTSAIRYNIDNRMEQYPKNSDLADLLLGTI